MSWLFLYTFQQEKNEGSFDFIFVDADKDNYIHYHERAIKLVRVGGIIAYDNTLWSGAVAALPEDPLPQFDRMYAECAKKLNTALAADKRIEVSQLSIADGVTLCRRVAWCSNLYKFMQAYNKCIILLKFFLIKSCLYFAFCFIFLLQTRRTCEPIYCSRK